MNILIIDDDSLTLHSLMKGIGGLGHSASAVMNAREAMQKVSEENYDLVLSDVMLPGISGLSLVKIIRTVNLCSMPIILMSTMLQAPLLETALQEGASDFIAKPFSMNDLAMKINKYKKQ